jgi:hypothetical protein
MTSKRERMLRVCLGENGGARWKRGERIRKEEKKTKERESSIKQTEKMNKKATSRKCLLIPLHKSVYLADFFCIFEIFSRFLAISFIAYFFVPFHSKVRR